MPFHIEISSPFDCARVLNINEAELRGKVLDFWVSGLPFKFHEKDWEPRECRLTILEGPEIESGSDGAKESWDKALRAADDVTRQMLETTEASAPTRIAVVVEADSVEAALRDLRSGRPPEQIPWATAIERIGSSDPDLTALVLVVKRSKIGWPEL